MGEVKDVSGFEMSVACSTKSNQMQTLRRENIIGGVRYSSNVSNYVHTHVMSITSCEWSIRPQLHCTTKEKAQKESPELFLGVLYIFKRLLKTHLFRDAFSCNGRE